MFAGPNSDADRRTNHLARTNADFDSDSDSNSNANGDRDANADTHHVAHGFA